MISEDCVSVLYTGEGNTNNHVHSVHTIHLSLMQKLLRTHVTMGLKQSDLSIVSGSPEALVSRHDTHPVLMENGHFSNRQVETPITRPHLG